MEEDNKQEDNIQDSTKPKYSVSNTALIVLILLCIAILVGNGLLKSHNQKQLRRLVEDYPEYFDQSSSSKVIMKFKSSDGQISFSYPGDWTVEEVDKDPLQITLLNSATGDACVIMSINEDIDPATRLSQTADAYKRNCKKYTDVSGITRCTIANLPAVRKDFDVIMPNADNVCSMSLVLFNVNGKLISLSENATSRVKLGKIFKTIEESLSINNQ